MADLVITDQNFQKEVLSSETPVLVDFWAPWCGPCKIVGPIIEELAKDLEGKVKVGKLNVDENNDTAGQFGVMSIPTIMIFKKRTTGQDHGRCSKQTKLSAGTPRSTRKLIVVWVYSMSSRTCFGIFYFNKTLK